MINRDDSQVDFELLKQPSNPDFVKYLKISHLKVKQTDLPKYYNILISHFSTHLHTKTGNEILLTICKSLNDIDSINIFAQEKLIEQLPFDQPEFRTQLMDLLYILSKNVPDIFTAEIASKIMVLVDSEPHKCLLIIAYFAQQFENVREPFPMVDILFRKADSFKSIECADDYVSLLVWMLKTYPLFKEQRIQHCWTYVCDMLTLSNVAILNTCYYGLCAIAEVDGEAIKDVGYPYSAISAHIRRRPIQAAALSLLMRYPPQADTHHMANILLALLDVAQEEEKAAFLLMGLLMDGTNAYILLQNHQWMTKSLPKTLHTMRLFIIIMLHPELRELIVQTPQTIDFFRSLLSENSLGMCNAICTMLRRLPLTPDFVVQLSESGFLGSYFASVLENENNDAMLSALRLLDTISRVKYVPEMSEMVDTVVRLIKSGNDLSLAAASVAIDMCKYPKCAKLFKAKRLNEFFKQSIENPKMKQYADRFLQVLSRVERAL